MLPPLITKTGGILENPPMYHYKYNPNEVHGEEDDDYGDNGTPKKTLAKRYYITQEVKEEFGLTDSEIPANMREDPGESKWTDHLD